MANYGHSRKKHNFARTFFAKNKPLTTTYTFLDWNKTNLEKNTTNRLPKSSEIWNFDCQLLPLTFFVSPTFGKWKNKIEKWVWMNSLFSIVHYEKLHTQILNVLRKIAKTNTASISFSIYLSLKSPPTLIRIYGLSMCFSFKILSR